MTNEFNDEHPFPMECLPKSLRLLAQNVAASTLTPVTIAAVAGLITVSCSLGRNLSIVVNKKECVCGNLYSIPVIDSGIGKRRVTKLMAKPLYDAHDNIQQEWLENIRPEAQAELDDIEEQIATCKGKLKSGKGDRGTVRLELKDLYKQKAQAEKELLKPELFTTSATEAKLATLLRDNNEVMSTIASEAGDSVQIIAGKYNGIKQTEDNLLLSSYSQEIYKPDRQTTECSYLKQPTVTLM